MDRGTIEKLTLLYSGYFFLSYYHIIIEASSKDVAFAAEASHLWLGEDAKQKTSYTWP